MDNLANNVIKRRLRNEVDGISHLRHVGVERYRLLRCDGPELQFTVRACQSLDVFHKAAQGARVVGCYIVYFVLEVRPFQCMQTSGMGSLRSMRLMLLMTSVHSWSPSP